ncbi:MAG: hypothetical protein ACI4QA_06615 [Candidatus Spyradosoma sp.]
MGAFSVLFFLVAAVCLGVPAAVASFVISRARLKNAEERLDRLERELRGLRESARDAAPAKTPSPVPETPPELPRPPAEPAEPDFAETLRARKILPPRGMPLETLLMQWWAPRVGGLLALIALIFFGVWASRFSSPSVRVVEMAAVALAATGIGLFLRRRGNDSLGDPLTATGTTMIYLVALAAGTFPPTKLIDSAPLALAVQLAATLPTFLLARGRLVPLNMGLAFAFVSAFVAVLCGAGAAGLFTAALAYCVALFFAEKKNAFAFLLTGALGAYLPLWALRPEIPADMAPLLAQLSAQSPPTTLFLFPEFCGTLILFLLGMGAHDRFVSRAGTRPSAALKGAYALNALHGVAATLFALALIADALPSAEAGREVFALAFSLAALVFGVGAVVEIFRGRRLGGITFAGTFDAVACAVTAPLALFFWQNCETTPALFRFLLAEAALIALAGRALKAPPLLLPFAYSLFFASAMLGGEENLARLPFFAATLTLASAWFFGGETFRRDDSVRAFSGLAAAVAGIGAGAALFVFCRDFPDTPTLRALALAACFLLAGAAAFPQRLAGIPSAFAAGTLVFLFGFTPIALPRFVTAAAACLALALILAGLFARVRALRVGGIALLAGTLARLFTFDVTDTTWRVGAFALVAVALFLIGLAYRRKSERERR